MSLIWRNVLHSLIKSGFPILTGVFLWLNLIYSFIAFLWFFRKPHFFALILSGIRGYIFLETDAVVINPIYYTYWVRIFISFIIQCQLPLTSSFNISVSIKSLRICALPNAAVISKNLTYKYFWIVYHQLRNFVLQTYSFNTEQWAFQ